MKQGQYVPLKERRPNTAPFWQLLKQPRCYTVTLTNSPTKPECSHSNTSVWKQLSPNAAHLPPRKMRRSVDIQARGVEHKLCHCPV